ncbi:MAG: hypothetical protein CSA62_00825 [Planctomycetota bacterium]|nr:MAG: hypothetical protein CSA62_00825 [Planctomycetota bacterium]
MTARVDGIPQSAAGFTLIELMIVVSIIAVLATIGTPMYLRSLNSARYARAKQELQKMSTDIDLYQIRHEMLLPYSLADVGHGGRRDPWGTLYCYLNLQSGGGDGMDWAFDAGLVDTSYRLVSPLDSNDEVKVARLVPMVTPQAEHQMTQSERDLVSDTISGAQRRDKFLFPINTDYDLFSRGPDRKTAVSLSSVRSLDDMIRGNDGDYFGKGSDY